MENYLVIGEITKPQGVRGEIKLRPITCDVERFDGLTLAYLKRGEEYVPRRRTGNRRAAFKRGWGRARRRWGVTPRPPRGGARVGGQYFLAVPAHHATTALQILNCKMRVGGFCPP